jgi:carbonic anhydrase/acetyltransferase-like protein (isoleucine patch superfamily)
MQSIHDSVWIAPGVQVYGRVSIARGSSLWPNATIRAEACEVEIGAMTNLQDFTMVHVGYESATRIGAYCSITHHATVHGCTIGDYCLIGIGATIMDGAEIGAGSIVGGGALVPEGKSFPANSVIVGIPAKRVAERDSARENRLNAWNYWRNAQHYRRGEHRAWDGPEYADWLRKKRAAVERDEDLQGEPW